MALEDRVQISRRFQRSIRIDTDWRSRQALQGFVCPRSSAEVLDSMARHIRDTGHSSFTWTGPYGSGKSSLVIALSALLSSDTRVRREAVQIVGSPTAKRIWQALPVTKKGWDILRVVGRRDVLPSVLGDALAVRKLARQPKDRK